MPWLFQEIIHSIKFPLLALLQFVHISRIPDFNLIFVYSVEVMSSFVLFFTNNS